jgi:hypothetical protein
MEKPPQLSPVYRLISSDDYEFVVQPKFLENSEPLKAIFTGKFKESKQNKLSVLLSGAALETLLNLMHMDQINDNKGITDQECFKRLTSVLHADPNRGDYILDLLAKANEWMVCPMITNAIATEAAELIFHDERARAECMQKMSIQDQLYLLDKFSLARRCARNYIPAFTVLHAMKNKKEITQDHELDKNWKWSVRCFLVAALDHVREWAAQSGARTVAEFINSSVLQELDPFFKDKLYKKLEDPECVDSHTVYAMDRIDDMHVVYGGEHTAGILDLENNTVKDLQNNLSAANPTGPVGDYPVSIRALASLSCDRFIMSQRFYNPGYSNPGYGIDITSKMGSMIKRRAFEHPVRRILTLDNQRVAFALGTTNPPFDEAIQIIDGNNLSECQAYIGHQNVIYCMLQVGSQLVSGSQDCTVRVWNLNVDDKGLHEADHKMQYHCPIYSLLHLGGPYVVSFGYNTAIWDIETGENVTKTLGSHYSLVSCDGVNNSYGGKATIARKGERDCSLEKLLEKISNIPNLQTVIPFNPDHLLAVYDKHESGFAEPMHAAIRVWNIHDGRMVSDQFIEKDSIASIICADNKIIYGTTTGLMVKHVPQAYPSLTALLERLTLQKP